MDSYQKLVEATAYLKTQTSQNPKLAIVLGSGLGNFINEIDVVAEIEYDAIPIFLFLL
jgi:purine-nucleoside phosphorylase